MTVIRKTPEDYRVPPNFSDYERTRAEFRWSDVPNHLELAQLSRPFTNVLRSLVISRGDRIFTIMGRSSELYVTILGAPRNGSMVSPMFSGNSHYPGVSSRHVIDVPIGVLVGLRRCSEQQAFNEIASAVSETGVNLGSICRRLIELVSDTTDSFDERPEVAGLWGDLARPLNCSALPVNRENGGSND